MAIAIYEDLAGRRYWADSTSSSTIRNLVRGDWLLYDDTPSTPPPATDPLGAEMAERVPGTGPFAAALRAASVAAVEDAETVAPAGAWDFVQAPTIAGEPLGTGGGGTVTPDATPTVKGKLQLAGDLGGTAAAPTVPGLATKVNSSTYTTGIADAKARANHTGTQSASTVTGLATVATTGAYSDLSGKPTIPAAYTDEQVRDVIGTALVAGANVTITPNDVGDTITIAAAGGGGGGAGLPATVVNRTTAYTATVGDFVQADVTTAGFTVTLPTAPATGALVSVKKIDASANTLTIAPAAGGTIDGDPNATTTTRWAGAVFEHVGSNVWRIVAVMTSSGPKGDTGDPGPPGDAGPAGIGYGTPENVNPQSVTGAYTVPDIATATVHRLTLTGNATLTFPTPAAGKSFTLVLVQDATGSRTVTWPGTVVWPGGTAPVLTATGGKRDVLSFLCADATNWLGFVSGQNY